MRPSSKTHPINAIRPTALLELLLASALVLSFIWIWEDAFPGAFVVVSLALLAFVVSASSRRQENLADVGLRIDNLPQAAALAALVAVPSVGVITLVGWLSGSLHFPAASRFPSSLATAVLFGILQQYALLAFFYRRIVELAPVGCTAPLATAAIFAVFHLPNPLLVCVAFFGGLAACWIYRRAPNIPAIGVAHGCLSFCLYHALSRDMTAGLRVGPDYWELMNRL